MILNWFAKLAQKFRSFFRTNYMLQYVEDEPSTLINKTIYVIGDEDFPAIATFNCPCGCMQAIQLNLIPTKNKPSWSIDNLGGMPTIAPSVWRKVGCRSHFFIRAGKVVWAKP